jgi:heparinase II/III-like protein
MGDVLDRLAAWWYTLRYQEPEQFPERLRYWLAWKLYPRFPTAVRVFTEPPAQACHPRADFSWRGAPPPFQFLNEPFQPAEQMDWNPSGRSLLWRFHLHYFDWAPHWELQRLARQIDHWIGSNPPGAWPAWHPYPTSLRIVNWIRAFGSAMPPDIAHSLATQAAFLEHNLEFHLGGNHLLENAWALLAAGLFFDVGRWTSRGLTLLQREIGRQVLPDGGHYERSPYYHLRMTRLVCDAVDLLRNQHHPIPSELSHASECMTRFAESLRHLDGSLPSFHDTVHAETPTNTQHPSPTTHESGYYILEAPQGRLIADYGAPGSHPNPAHQHAGIFSFEISCPDGLVIVDGGTPTYDPGPERDHLRSTAAHNTVRVDGRDQFQVWKGFRAGRRAWVSGVLESADPDFPAVSATHDGYSVRGVLHRRTIARVADAGWLVVDDLEGSGSHRLESFLHLVPGLRPVITADRITLEPLGWTLLPFGFAGPPTVLDDVYAPAIGDRRASCTLVFAAGPALPGGCGFFLGPRSLSVLVRESHNVFHLDDLQLTLSLL